MKPLNYKNRGSQLLKFAGVIVLVLSLFGFGLYSQNIVSANIRSNSNTSLSEIKELEKFTVESERIVESFKNANSQVERNSISLELDKYVLDKKKSFTSFGSLIVTLDGLYKQILICDEKIKKLQDGGDVACEAQMKELEDQIAEMEQANNSSGNTNVNVKAGLQRTLIEVNSLLATIDGKNFLGMGVKKMRNDIRNNISVIKQDLENQIGLIQ